MKRSLLAPALVYTILAVLFCRLVLSSGKADWLSVDIPEHAHCGEPFPVRVTLLNSGAGAYLSADLHWIDKSGEFRGYLSGSVPEPASDGKSTYTLSIPVNCSEETSSVFGVIVLSLNGTWSTRMKAASLDPVPVICKESSVHDNLLKPVTPVEISVNMTVPVIESVILRYIIAGIWFLTALSAIIFSGLLHGRWIAAGALLCSIWEGLNCTPVVGGLLRSLLSYTGSYNYRHLPQQILLFAVVFFISVFFFRHLLKERNSADIILSFCMVLYCGISLLGVISLHETDMIFSKTVAGFTAGQITRLAVSSMGFLVFITDIVSSRIRRRSGF